MAGAGAARRPPAALRLTCTGEMRLMRMATLMREHGA